MSWIVSVVELILEHTPVLGKLKVALERDYPQRPLSAAEILEPGWLSAYLDFVNRAFRGTTYDYPYRPGQVKDWLLAFPQALIVLVAKRLVAWPPARERVVACIKMLPLKEDIVLEAAFDPFKISGWQVAGALEEAKAIWIGDLVSTKDQLLLLVMVVRSRLEKVEVPVYCRTEKPNFRRILFERYGARVLHPDGRPADGSTILVFQRATNTIGPN